jgi:hypothetical protein
MVDFICVCLFTVCYMVAVFRLIWCEFKAWNKLRK